METQFEISAGHVTAGKRFINFPCLVPGVVPRYAFTCSEQPKKLVPGATMTDRNRSFGAALAIVAVLIAVTALAAMLAP